jgi:hypothetical protein
MSDAGIDDVVEALKRAVVLEAQAKDASSFESYRLRQENARLREENERLDGIARAAAAWCSEHPDEGTPLLRDLLHAHGYDPRHREPDPDVWRPKT